MARLPNVGHYNEERIKAIKINTILDDAMVLTVDETKKILRDFINEELSFFAEDVIKSRRIEVEERLNFKLKQFENSMIRHIDDKLNKITEHIVSLTINRVIEEEVNKRLEIKLDKIKKQL